MSVEWDWDSSKWGVLKLGFVDNWIIQPWGQGAPWPCGQWLLKLVVCSAYDSPLFLYASSQVLTGCILLDMKQWPFCILVFCMLNVLEQVSGWLVCVGPPNLQHNGTCPINQDPYPLYLGQTCSPVPCPPVTKPL